MFKNISISRANVVSTICDPLQWSENLQLAINNGNQLTILDPKLPLIHQSLTSSTFNGGTSEYTMLDTKKMFDISSILDSESIDNLNLRNFNNIVIETMDEKFGFGRITEPAITQHSWSPVDPTFRDCYLGVLFNTSELLILQRSDIKPNDYSVRFNIFNELLLKLDLLTSNYSNGEIILNYEQYLSLRTQCYQFSRLFDYNEAKFFLSLGNANNEISVYMLANGLPQLFSINVGFAIVKQSWSPWFKKGSHYHSYLTVVGVDNSVVLYEISFDPTNDTMSVTGPVELLDKSRFLISQCEFHEVDNTFLLIITSTMKLQVFKIDSLKTPRHAVYKLLTNSLASGIFQVAESKGSLDINIAFEGGQFEVVQVDLKSKSLSIKPIPPHNSLLKFVSKNLHKYQLYNSKLHDIEDLTESNNTTTPFLNSIVEGNFINYGTKLNANGIVSIIYRIHPKNVLNYTILSKNEFNIGFIPLRELYPEVVNNNNFGTSISYMNKLWFNKYNEIPKFPKLISENKQEEIALFIENMQRFKQECFINTTNVIINITNVQPFNKFLISNFIENITIKELQYLLTFNTILSRSITILRNKSPQYDKIIEFDDSINEEQLQIESIIFKHLIKSVIYFIKQNNPEIPSNLDRFIIIAYYLLLSESDPDFESKFPGETEITMKTKFFLETFKVSVNDMINDDSTNQIVSTTNHKWPRCRLTFLPLLELKNKVDELKKFNYIMHENAPIDWITQELMETLDFCIYSGNKKYEVN